MQISGIHGELQWGYHIAAHVRGWTAARGDSGWSLHGTLVDPHVHRLSQRPLYFEVRTAKGVWRWPCVELQITGASFTAVLGPKE